jgi:folate-binding protein YgfZ
VFLDLSGRAKFRLTGSDRVRFLNGQVTNDVRKANANLAMAACVLNAKGKTDALIFISGKDEELLIDAEPELREALPRRLERYLIADDVVIEDVSENYALFHVIAEVAPQLPNESNWRRSKRFGSAGWDLWTESAEHDRVLQALATQDVLSTEEAGEQFRIEQGIPRWGRELTDEIIPVEANLEGEAIDYAKGCYIGQETISRMKMSGQKNKRLCGLLSLEDVALAPGARLVAPEGDKDAGWITSATRSDRLGKEIALAYVKRGFNQPGTKLHAPDPVEVVDLPFR